MRTWDNYSLYNLDPYLVRLTLLLRTQISDELGRFYI
jgi:hypothetical protein